MPDPYRAAGAIGDLLHRPRPAYQSRAGLIAYQALLRYSLIETTRRFCIKRTENNANRAIDRMDATR
jgi:hypothetical protein